MARKKQVPELKVVFDTNALFTQAASDLVKPDVVALLEEHSSYPVHRITWHLPDIVRHERIYQMEKAALALLPSLKKTEKLLGHSFGFSEVYLAQRVRDAAESQVRTHNFNVIRVESSSVDWDTLMLDAVYRRPPFEAGDKEKGFRDSLVVESFRQLVKRSPVTPSVCRVVLVSEDRLVKEAAEAATQGSANVRILSDLEELRGLISTLVSEVGEDFVQAIKQKAEEYFFLAKDETTLYYKEHIRDRIRDEFKEELSAKPEGVVYEEEGAWYIANPRFVKKEGQRVFWATRVDATFKGFRTEIQVPQAALPFSIQNGTISSTIPSVGHGPLSMYAGTAPGLLAPPTKTFVCEYGKVFEVDWSATLGQHKKFSAAKIESIKFVETRIRSPQK